MQGCHDVCVHDVTMPTQKHKLAYDYLSSGNSFEVSSACAARIQVAWNPVIWSGDTPYSVTKSSTRSPIAAPPRSAATDRERSGAFRDLLRNRMWMAARHPAVALRRLADDQRVVSRKVGGRAGPDPHTVTHPKSTI